MVTRSGLSYAIGMVAGPERRQLIDCPDQVHAATVADEALVHLQQARGFANYLEGGKNHGGVTSEHHMDNREAADSVREELDKALQLLGLRA